MREDVKCYLINVCGFTKTMCEDMMQNYNDYMIARKSLRFKMPLKHMVKYVGAAAMMALLLYVLPHPTRLTVTVALTLIEEVFTSLFFQLLILKVRLSSQIQSQNYLKR
jgi:hypothetical protein